MKKILIILTISLVIFGCNNHKKVDGVYRYYMGKVQNYDIWIVDGNQVRLKIFSSFLYGGNELKKVSATDYSNIKEIKGIPDSIKISNIYRVPMGEQEGISVWIVDGYMVRKNIYPDFGFSGNDLSYHFIPPKEIWIDAQVSCDETEYSIATELKERKLIEAGKSYDDAYSDAIDITLKLREEMVKLAGSHFKIAIPDSITKYAGTIDPNEN